MNILKGFICVSKKKEWKKNLKKKKEMLIYILITDQLCRININMRIIISLSNCAGILSV